MSKVFRLHREGSNTYEDWNSSPAYPYNNTALSTIEDPDGASASQEITSIPSPFARIDLVKNAFREVCKPQSGTRQVSLDGDTIYHKMVSDTLDVAEIFFNIDKLSDKVEIIKWNPQSMLSELEESGIDGHFYLADALRKYMASDARTYNFGALLDIYLLNYKNGPNELNIIGATSPATLFFSNANELDYVDISIGQHKPFDSDYQPLYRRDFEFVKYLFALRKSITEFQLFFPEIDKYLSHTYTKIADVSKKQELQNIANTYLDTLAPISVAGARQNNYAEVLDFTLYKKANKPVESDFIIGTTKQTTLRPLVLPVENGNRYRNLQYTTDKWGTQNMAPYYDGQTDLTKRSLPADGAVNPYLTISDFMEDTLVKVEHKLNSEDYFDGNWEKTEEKLSYLLPIKPLLFEYFTIEELMGVLPDGSPMIEMKSLAGNAGVKATLRVPIKGDGNIKYIEYSRLYYQNRAADLDHNEGRIEEFIFTGGIMPMIKFTNPANAIYNLVCIKNVQARYEFRLFSEDKQITDVISACRNTDTSLDNTSNSINYLVKGRNFDYVQVTNKQAQGIIIPKFRPQRNLNQYEFSIDLGTSNTHIEYRKANETSTAVFSYDHADRLFCEMFVPVMNQYGALVDLEEETKLLEKDFLPEDLGINDFYLPTRTVLSCAQSVDWNNSVDPFMMVNIPFSYDKRRGLEYNNYKYNIKWGKGEDLLVMESYIRSIMLIIRNKVLLNNGDISKTKITWFYPISMPPKRLIKLQESWNKAYNEYFGDGSTNRMTESDAPIQYYFKRYATATDLVNIDIGGGTTDIAFAKEKKIENVTSFRFAANALFENSFTEWDDNNGIVDYYKQEILKVLEDKNLNELIEVFNSATNRHPANMASFLFGLKDNTIPKKNGVNPQAVDLNFKLREDDNFRIVFILFYTSIIYHIAQIVKIKGMELPRHISFSGNGSKVIRIVTSDPQTLAKYTKLIFEKVIGRPYGKELTLLGMESDANPKVSTCKGGLVEGEVNDVSDKEIVLKSDGSGFVTKADTYVTITKDYEDRTIDAVRRFFSFVFDEMNSEFDFDRNFGISTRSVNIAREVSAKDLDTYLKKGIAQRRSETKEEDMIEETFFFYPIKGVLNAVSAEIYKGLKSNAQ